MAASGPPSRRGERAYQVLAPLTRKVTDPDQPDDPNHTPRAVVGWRLESVFDLSQTDGETPCDPPAAPLPTGEGPTGAYQTLAGVLAGQGWTVTRQPIDGDTQGYTRWSDRHVAVRQGLDDAAAFYVLAHEAAHVSLHEGSGLPRPVKEVEADSVAFLVAHALGLDTAPATAAYLTGWANGNPELVLAVAGRVIDTAARILDAFPTDHAPDSPPTDAPPTPSVPHTPEPLIPHLSDQDRSQP